MMSEEEIQQEVSTLLKLEPAERRQHLQNLPTRAKMLIRSEIRKQQHECNSQQLRSVFQLLTQDIYLVPSFMDFRESSLRAAALELSTLPDEAIREHTLEMLRLNIKDG